MMLFFQDTTDEFGSGGIDIQASATAGLIGSITSAMETGLKPNEQFKVLSQMEDKAKELQKTIGSGLVIGGDAFREKIEQIYIESTELGVSFKDVTDVMGGLAKSVGRIIDPSKDVVSQMAILGKNVGIASEAMGTMVGEFMKLTFSQEKSVDLMNKITEQARRAGVNAKTTLEAVSKNLSKVDAYGFKNGVEGLTKMTIQAQQLRTSVEEIGAVQMGQTFWDPEKAIETAAGMSMLGGSMSELMNPFQLMNMGANNVEKLQSSLIDLSASAFKINETTGEVETNFVAQQRLKQQLEALGKGGEYEKFINLGREAAKQSKIIADINKSGLGTLFEGEGKTFTEEDQRLIASLSEVKDGKISLNIPGFGQIDNLQESLSGNPEKIKDALQKYQEQAAMSEKDIATKSLSTVDNIKNDTAIIKQTLLRSLTASERTAVLLSAGGAAEGLTEGAKTTTATAATGLKNTLTDPNVWKDIITNNPPTPANDKFFGEGTKTMSTGKGEMFSFIKDDQAVFAPDLDNKLGILKSAYLQLSKIKPNIETDINVKPQEFKQPELKLPDFSNFEKMITPKSTEIETKKEIVQRVEGSGSININVNITSNGSLADSLMSDRRFKSDLETEILNTMKNKDLLMVQKP